MLFKSAWGDDFGIEPAIQPFSSVHAKNLASCKSLPKTKSIRFTGSESVKMVEVDEDIN